MAKAGHYQDVGKKTKDLLSKDFSYTSAFTFLSTSANGQEFAFYGQKTDDKIAANLKTVYKYNNVKSEVKVDSNSKIFVTTTVEDIAPGLKAIIGGFVPDTNSAKAEFIYSHHNAGVAAVVGLTARPKVHLAAVVGSDGVVLGGEVGYDTSTGKPTKYDAALGFQAKDVLLSLHLADRGDVIRGTFLQVVNPNTTFGVEIVYKLSENKNTFTAGASYKLDPLTTVKTRMNNHGVLASTLQHEWKPKSFITFAGEVDTKALEKSAKVGIAILVKA